MNNNAVIAAHKFDRNFNMYIASVFNILLVLF